MSEYNQNPMGAGWSRRDWMKTSAAAGVAAGMMPLTARAEQHNAQVLQGKAEHCIMIWLGGGAAQIDTFDPKRLSKDGLKDPGSAYPAIDTSVPGIQVCEHLPQTAQLMEHCTLVRSLHHDVIDEHAAASYRMHIGRPVSGTVVYPSIGSTVIHQKEALSDKVPSYVLMGYPSPGRLPGFLGPEYGFVYLTDTATGPKGLTRPARISSDRDARRKALLDQVTERYERGHLNDQQISAYLSATRQGFRLAGPDFLNVFELDNEPSDLRNQYGDEFGQRCLMARRLIERGTRFVEVSFNLTFVNGTGWDTHQEGQQTQHLLIQSLDQAFSTLIKDLQSKKLLDKTLLVICGEFGRPAGFDGGGGRGHWGKTFSGVLAGGGLNNGQAIGVTDDLAQHFVEGRQVSVPDWFATIYAALGINYQEELYAGDRPVPITDGGQPIAELFT